jgi:type IV pilus assembly protein PilB
MALSSQQLQDVFVAPGHMTPDEWLRIEEYAQAEHTSCTDALIAHASLKRSNIGEGIATAYEVPYCALEKQTVAQELLQLIPERAAAVQCAVIIAVTKGVYTLATAHPENYNFIDALARKLNSTIEVHYALPDAVEHVLLGYGGGARERIALAILHVQTAQYADEPASAVVALVDTILAVADDTHASDIHLEPSHDHAIIRFRIDGILEQVGRYPKALHEKLCARIKILAGLRTDEQVAPQDGRFTFSNDALKPMNARVSFAPVVEGENVVLRLLHEDVYQLTLMDLGLTAENQSTLLRAAEKPQGMIIAVGPTGSGKTTTLYTVLKTLNTSDVNIMTIEDPVEYRIENVQQIQVNPAKDIHFATGLRTIVRQDPDVILVGEIRDAEAADIAVNAAMTGHLVLTTMHTNDAATTFPRLAEMGVEDFLVTSSVNLIVAQRLVRVVCELCRKSKVPNEAVRIALAQAPELRTEILRQSNKSTLEEVMFYEGGGCAACGGVGYRGRVGVFELLEVNEYIRPLILQHASAQEITSIAHTHGMESMLSDAVRKVLSGTTTLEEIFRSVYS